MKLIQSFKRLVLIASVAAVLLLTVFSPAPTQAQSVQWNGGESVLYYYFLNPLCGAFGGACGGWIPGVGNANITITYSADVIDQTTSSIILPGSSIPVGTPLNFKIKDFTDTDIYWFGTGYSQDSPYGHFETSAGAPSTYGQCAGQDYVGAQYHHGLWKVYVPLSVAPPITSISHSGTAGLSCDASGALCTVTSPGTIDTTFNYGNTFGKFYYQYGYDGINGFGCVGRGAMQNNTSQTPSYSYGGEGQPLFSAEDYGLNTNGYSMPVAARSINFTATAVGSGVGPNIPTIIGPTTGDTGTSYTFNFTATHPEGTTLRYGVDWDNDSSVDEWLPSSGFVASGVSESQSRSWPSTGSYIFQALAQDSNGVNSGWANHTITISAGLGGGSACNDGIDNDGDGKVDFPVDDGCSGTSDNNEAAQCEDGIDNDGNGLIDYPADSTCSSSLDDVEGGVEANLSLTASPGITRPGETVTLNWSATGTESCSIGGSNSDSWILVGQSGAVVTSAISEETSFTLTCEKTGGGIEQKSVTVKITPSFQEVFRNIPSTIASVLAAIF